MDSSPGSTPYSAPTGCPMRGGRQTSLYGPEFAADPQRVYDEFRAHGLAAPIELAPGVEATLIVQHEAALRVLQNPSYFARDSRRWAALREGRVPLDSPVLPMMAYRPNCLFTDGTEHLRLRKAVTESLGRLSTTRLSRDVERIADYLIDQFIERGSADLLGDYAKLLPLLLFNQLFGCPGDIGDRLTRSMSAIFDGEDVLRANAELTECLMELVALKRRQPGEDITSWLIQHPAGLRDEELKDQLVMLMGAGVEPERNLIANALLLMLSSDTGVSHRRGTGMLVEDALDDVLWNNPPIANYATHYPVQDVDLGGVTLKADTPVLISFAAANSDPALTDARQTLSKGAHLAWGAGPHVCPAKSPAQLIALTAIEKILNSVPDLALAVHPSAVEWRPGPFHRALVSLPVHFTAAPARRTTTAPVTQSPVPSRNATPDETSAAHHDHTHAEPQKKTKGWWSSFLDVFRV
ncbi:cytochrome P450 [Streptomyces sp. NPDC018352]|uniref:cytochrome P450 n=1 Tax=Streptomyces sp. NPDC018352 TaxID=3157194 RepID=UPI0033F7623A